jgi:phospholipase C
MRNGEQHIADVYNAIHANDALWKSTLLVITSDEHGGFYDYAVPPHTIAPDNHTAEWSFDQRRASPHHPCVALGQAGRDKNGFDHASLLRYVYDKWNLPPLGLRMQETAGPSRANTFSTALTELATPREDTPKTLKAGGVPKVKP